MTSFLFFLVTIITTLGVCALHACIHEKSCNQTCISFVNCGEVPLKSELALFFLASLNVPCQILYNLTKEHNFLYNY